MASIAAQAAAKKVSEIVSTGGLVNMSSVLKDCGYSDSVCRSPTRVTRSQSFQTAITPVQDTLQVLAHKILAEMDKKMKNASFRDLVYGFDVISKNIMLLKGRATEVQYGANIELTDAEKKKIEMLLRDIPVD